jgi:hypothetical protein
MMWNVACARFVGAERGSQTESSLDSKRKE